MPVEDINERQVSLPELRSRSKLSMFGEPQDPGSVRSKDSRRVEVSEGDGQHHVGSVHCGKLQVLVRGVGVLGGLKQVRDIN